MNSVFEVIENIVEHERKENEEMMDKVKSIADFMNIQLEGDE